MSIARFSCPTSVFVATACAATRAFILFGNEVLASNAAAGTTTTAHQEYGASQAQYRVESGSYYRSKRYQAEITFDSEPHKPDKDSRYEKPLRMEFHS